MQTAHMKCDVLEREILLSGLTLMTMSGRPLIGVMHVIIRPSVHVWQARATRRGTSDWSAPRVGASTG